MKKKRDIFAIFTKQHRLFVMLLPTLVLVTVFSYFPLTGWIMAFTDYRIGSDMLSNRFVGLKEFISFFPFFVSWVITYNVFNAFLGVESGVINNIIKYFGGRGINFMGNPAYSWGLMVFITFWKYIGYDIVIFLAAIAGIDQEQYEAACIDGAGRMAKIKHITMPALVPTLVMILIINSGWIFSANFEQYYMFYNRSNWSKMEVLSIYTYRFGFQRLDFSYATAVGVVQTFASMLMFVAVNRIAKRLRDQSLI